jgi:soluble lytic murein transglycosylase-like protein
MALTSLSKTLEYTITYTAIPVQAQEIESSLTKQVQSIKDHIKSRIGYYADLYEVSEEVMNVVVQCESNYDPNALGDKGASRGLTQINRPAHPNISDEQAFDIEFSLDFLAENLSKDKGRLWTCWKKFNADL